MTYTAPWTDRIMELLADGPKTLEYLVAETRNLVPPGRAYRQAEKTRNRIRAGRGREPATTESTDDETIRVGQRSIVVSTITKMIARDRLRYTEIDGVRWIRLGREREKAINPIVAKLNEHQPSFYKRQLDGIVGVTGRPVYAIDALCSCGLWSWSGAERNEDGLWEVWTTSKGQVKIEFTKHRRSFV